MIKKVFTILANDEIIDELNKKLFDNDVDSYYKKEEKEIWLIRKRNDNDWDDKNILPYELVTEDGTQIDVLSQDLVDELSKSLLKK